MGEGLPRMRIREGCRGGSEQFSWNFTKKEDFKDREQYLGISTKVGLMGKFGRYYVHDWYAKSRETAATIGEEKDAVKAYEEELMQEALGNKPKKLLLARKQLTPEEMKQLLKKESDKKESEQGRAQMGGQKKILTNKEGDQVEASNEDLIYEGAKDAPIKGIGFASHRTARLEAMKAAAVGVTGELEGTSASSFMKKEEVKTEVKPEIKSEAFTDRDSFTLGAKQEKREVKQEDAAEVKAEEQGPRDARGGKRPREEEAEEAKEERSRGKAGKKDKESKKLKKVEKKLKKLAKKEKKALKKEKKAEKAAKKAAKQSSSSSSS